MLLNAVAKLQTPNSKKGFECFQEIRRLAPQKLCYDEKETRGDNAWIENEGNDCTAKWNDFQYKSPTELMMSELEDNLKI